MDKLSRMLLEASGKSFFGAFTTEKGRHLEDDPMLTPGRRLLDAILANELNTVQLLLEHGVNPNDCIGIISSHFVFTEQQQQDKVLRLDKVFLWKKIFGEAPTPVHIAVVNVYHRAAHRRELKKALGILKLLLDHGGDVSQVSHNIFLRKFPVVIETNPLDLALGVQRMTLWMHLEHSEQALVHAVDIMRAKYDPTSMAVQRVHRIPFQLVSLPLLDRVQEILFSKRLTADQDSDITFVSSDGSRFRRLLAPKATTETSPPVNHGNANDDELANGEG